MKNSKYRTKKLRRKISILLIAALVISAVNTTGFSFNSNKVLADTVGYELATAESLADGVEPLAEISTENGSTEASVTETPVIEESTTEIETTTQLVTTQPITTQPVTTQPVTTQPQTTKPTASTTTTTVKPWGKNSKGQFVNGNKKVISGATMKGIDVSKWNGQITWKKVAASDVDFAIIRCGYGDDIKSQDDEYWTRNVTKCEEYNIPYGVYIYSYATTVKQAKSEAAHVLRLVAGHTLNFPIYYDMEDSCQANLSKTKRENIANAFLTAIKAAGYECGIYANLNWWTNYLPTSLAEQTSWKWVAQYNDNACTYTGTYQMWQCTSEGTVDGIKGNVDLNFWFGPVRDRLYNIKNSTQNGTTISAPKPVTPPKRVTIKSVKKAKKRVTIKWKKLSAAKGYQVQYSTKKSFKKKYRKSTATTKTSITIKKLKSKTTYYFRVRAYKKNAAGKRVYSKKWSKIKSKKIK